MTFNFPFDVLIFGAIAKGVLAFQLHIPSSLFVLPDIFVQ